MDDERLNNCGKCNVMKELEEILELYNVFAYSQGYNDLVALVPGDYKDIVLNPSIDNVKIHHVFPVSKMSLDLNVNQNPTHMVGAFETSNVVGTALDVSVSFDLPIFASLHGWVQSSFASLWYLTGLAVFGSPLTVQTEVLSYNEENRLVEVDNIAEFIELLSMQNPLPVVALDENLQYLGELSVSNADRQTRKLYIGSSLPTYTKYLVAVEENGVDSSVVETTLKSPTFMIWSFNEGLIGPCLVDSLTITSNAQEELVAKVEIKAMYINRRYQVDFQDHVSSLASDLDLEEILYPILGTNVEIETAEGYEGNYGHFKYIKQGLTEGYQTPHINDSIISNTTLTIKNNLKTEHTTSSLRPYPQSSYDNQFPSLIYSEGRKIEGTVNLLVPLKPMQVLEKLATSGYVNTLEEGSASSGLRLIYGAFALTLPGVVWSPSSREGNVDSDNTATLKWYMFSKKKYGFPNLEYLTV